MRYVLALDQGTTSSRAIVFDQAGHLVASENYEFEQIFPQPGWVEHNPADILSSQVRAMRGVMERSGLTYRDIAAVGITNQRETTLIWDRKTGEPIYNAIVWQCRRTAELCQSLRKEGWEQPLREKTGLVLDAYFSATKVKWLLDHVPGARERAQRGDLAFGTVDTWLLWHLSGGRVHATDYSNAARTMMFNINTLQWDEDILKQLDIPASILPTVVPNSGRIAMMDPAFLGGEVPISGMAGDQHAALFGQACFNRGNAKNTYGTGGFLLLNTGNQPVASQNGLLTTIGWHMDGKTEYALEGSIFIAGAAVQWLRDQLQIVESAAETQALAMSVKDNGGVYFVPAFTGLGAPYWDMYSRGTVVGLTRGTGRAHLVRAVLEAIAYQTRDVLDAMQRDAKLDLSSLSVDGGACRNDFLMQFQADILGVPVSRPRIIETTALGAAFFAGLAEGIWQNREELAKYRHEDRLFIPQMASERRAALQRQWSRAVERSRSWLEE